MLILNRYHQILSPQFLTTVIIINYQSQKTHQSHTRWRLVESTKTTTSHGPPPSTSHLNHKTHQLIPSHWQLSLASLSSPRVGFAPPICRRTAPLCRGPRRDAPELSPAAGNSCWGENPEKTVENLGKTVENLEKPRKHMGNPEDWMVLNLWIAMNVPMNSCESISRSKTLVNVCYNSWEFGFLWELIWFR